MRILGGVFTIVAGLLAGAAAAQPGAAEIKLWRLDCGTVVIKNYGAFFSDTMAYPPGPKTITSSCYLIRHGDRYMLWDTGVPASFAGKTEDTPAQTISLGSRLTDQLARIGVKPEQIEIIGISHYHFDHIGQAADFPKAKLVIGAGDLAALKADPPAPGMRPELIAPWLNEGAQVLAATSDVDIFQDGRVVMLKMPGHTPGHSALLVRLKNRGPILLTGDLYHFTEQVAIDGVPPFNTDRADTLASMDRFKKLAKNLGATVVIQHEAADIARLPAFPAAAD